MIMIFMCYLNMDSHIVYGFYPMRVMGSLNNRPLIKIQMENHSVNLLLNVTRKWTFYNVLVAK